MNTRIFIIAFLFGLIETGYFGWNIFPASPAEVICDGITMLLYAMAFICRPAR